MKWQSNQWMSLSATWHRTASMSWDLTSIHTMFSVVHIINFCASILVRRNMSTAIAQLLPGKFQIQHSSTSISIQTGLNVNQQFKVYLTVYLWQSKLGSSKQQQVHICLGIAVFWSDRFRSDSCSLNSEGTEVLCGRFTQNLNSILEQGPQTQTPLNLWLCLSCEGFSCSRKSESMSKECLSFWRHDVQCRCKDEGDWSKVLKRCITSERNGVTFQIYSSLVWAVPDRHIKASHGIQLCYSAISTNTAAKQIQKQEQLCKWICVHTLDYLLCMHLWFLLLQKNLGKLQRKPTLPGRVWKGGLLQRS